MSMIESLERIYENLSGCWDELALHLEGVIAEITAMEEIEDMGNLVEILDKIKKDAEEAKRRINKSCSKVEEHFCNVLFDKELLPYRSSSATFSPSARGFFSISDPEQFIAWLEKEDTNPIGAFLEYATKKTPLRELCEQALEDGKPLPPGIRGHIERRVTIRRKRSKKSNGKEKEEF